MQRLWSMTNTGRVVDAEPHGGSLVQVEVARRRSVSRRPLAAFDADGGDLELGHLRQRVDGAVGELVGGLGAGPVVRDEHGVGPDRGDDVRRQGHRRRAARSRVTRSPSATPRRSARRGCISHSGSGYWRDERGDAAGLGARQVLADDPAGGEPDRVLVVDDLGRTRGTGTAWKRALPSGWKNWPPSNRRGVPGWPTSGTGQNRPISSSTRSQVTPRVVGGAAGADARQSSSKISSVDRCTGSTGPCRGARRGRAGSASRGGPRRVG